MNHDRFSSSIYPTFLVLQVKLQRYKQFHTVFPFIVVDTEPKAKPLFDEVPKFCIVTEKINV